MTNQQITLQFPLSRTDMKPDNTPLRAVSAVAERGFKIVKASVSEAQYSKGVERSLELVCVLPYRSRQRWIPLLISAMTELRVHGMDVDDGDGCQELEAA